ncbi:rubrerythrin family protein [Clostridium argentinense CDC 2741]|uniref:Rubrerythrin family protein n=1 Tax=Clostridium argentinense CDC 2741 TaxID=1418104 RepID=A0A0C1UJ47_9CLOT|nr:ferritin-like domain-containing protein [Clostridium argentinense]ARC85721.1 rubrerythrin [Clostridium argentinense]KIE47305.1 rubrerythrin family protein [Clostridium argentinense CDC 2741]NFF40753.1 ferritin-like domain-containing protein [Clostridium argentinense]NFP50685.1 ferritin-like domain-containing protein [Clostridium argentinense]NFP74691.1 ferritin-like domain-containing protein [Clostridium argentinense]
MSYTNPHGQSQRIAILDTNRLREILIAEIYAINGYADHIANSNMEDINEVWRSIMGDEKKHYGMILSLLRKYNLAQYRAYLEYINDKAGPKLSMQTYNPNYDKQIILNNIREDIKGEFEAIVLYEQHLAIIPYDDVRYALYSIINEEKGHIEHLTQLLLKYDTDKYNGLK